MHSKSILFLKIVYMYEYLLSYILIICLSVDGELYWFQFFATMNRAAIYLGYKYLSGRVWSSQAKCPGVE